ncbi:hypothetical protein B566_EDAN012084 [Ephemera danica]|nr:hypothetical protein B566_EDAN012084 [Ephemera danica]
MENVNDASHTSREDNPELLIKTYEKMIADDLKRIEEEGGADADHLKACLYEKWVPELLDTISMLCKTTSELEQVSTNAVIQLDHKLQDGACSTDVEGNSLLSLQTQLAAAQHSLEESREHCQDSERAVKNLEEKLAKRDVQLDNLLRNQRASDREDKIKALTLEVAAKHDVVCQLEERLRQAQQRDDQHQMQLNYQGMLLEALRKELKKYKKSANNSSEEKTVKDGSSIATSEQKTEDMVNPEGVSKAQTETCHAADSSKSQIEEQKVLISQLQDALVASKHKLEELQRCPESGTDVSAARGQVHDGKDDLIKSLRRNLAEMESQYSDCFSEETVNAGSQLANASCELAFAKAQLSIYKTKNAELEDELEKIKSTRSEITEEHELENCLTNYTTELSKNENVTLEDNLNLDARLTEEIFDLQACLNDGATLLYDKDLQITLLQEKLDEMCNESERQLKLMTKRDIALAELATSLDNVNKEKEALLNKICCMEQSAAVKSNAVEKKRQNSRESEHGVRLALEKELKEVKRELQVSQQELRAWKQRYNVINTNLAAKEKKIQSLRSELQERGADNEGKLREAEEQIKQLRLHLRESENQVSILRGTCQDQEQTITALKARLDDEIKKWQAQKVENEQMILVAEQQVSTLQQEIKNLITNHEAKEQELDTIYKEKENELQRLISMSCENVEGLQAANAELVEKLKTSEEAAAKISREFEETERLRCKKLEELAEARKEIETIYATNVSLQEQLQMTEAEVNETKERLGQFESELVLSSERVVQLQSFLSQAQQDRQDVSSQLAEVRSQVSAQSLAQQQQVAELTTQLQTAAVEKEHLERSQQRLEEMCKSLTAQLGGQRSERDRAVRGLRQAAAERSRLCQEARQVLSVARQWLAEHRASALEMQQLRAERDDTLAAKSYN